MKIRSLVFLTIFLWTAACGPLSGDQAPGGLAPAAGPTAVLAAGTDSPSTPVNQATADAPTPVCPNPDCVVATPMYQRSNPLRFSLPTPGANPVSIWRPPQYPVPWALGPFDHFYFARPIAADEVNWPLANYRYGGVFFPGVTHTGVDLDAKEGTAVLAAGPGTVVWADWGLFSFTPGNLSDPYGMAVVIRHDFGYRGQPLYTVYAHMRAILAHVGERVQTGTQIGEVGSTGATTGPHLHFEVRIGENSYYDTRNPELWIAPAEGWGVLVGRVMYNDHKLITNDPVYVTSQATGHQWVVDTYGPEAVNSDDYYQENMAISDLSAGVYKLEIIYSQKSYKTQVNVLPGQITYFSFRGEYGYSMEPPPLPTPDIATPPAP